MTIEKIFNDLDSQERIYSVLMSEEEIKLYSSAKKKKNQGHRLSIADQDYLEEIDNSIKANKYTMPIAGAAVGGSLGMAGGGLAGGKGALIGGTLGAVGGAYGFHKINKKYTEPRLVREKTKYVNSTPSDRAYFRRKREQEKNREAMMAAGFYAGR